MVDWYHRQANSPFLHCPANTLGRCMNQYRKQYRKMRWCYQERKLYLALDVTAALSTSDFSRVPYKSQFHGPSHKQPASFYSS